jgi:hypothetical protein
MSGFRSSAEEVPVIDFMDESQPFLERVLNYGLSGLSVIPTALENGQIGLPAEERDATMRVAGILGDTFTIQCDRAISIADRLPLVSEPGTELYRARAHQFLMTAVNETLRDIWQQMRMPPSGFLDVATTLQRLIDPFAQHGMLQPHWIMPDEVRATLRQIPVPHGLFLRVYGQELSTLDIREVQ